MTREQWAKRNFKQTNNPNHHFWDKTEKTDKELWFEVWCAVATSDGCKDQNIATSWADYALRDWHNRKYRL